MLLYPYVWPGLHEVGIFRLPGQASRILILKELYDSGCQQDFGEGDDVHTIASLIKLYLRELPEPVVPYLLFESYKEALEGMHQLVSLGHSLLVL